MQATSWVSAMMHARVGHAAMNCFRSLFADLVLRGLFEPEKTIWLRVTIRKSVLRKASTSIPSLNAHMI